MSVLGKWRTSAWLAVGLLAACAGEETIVPGTVANLTGGDVAPAPTGGVTTVTGGVTTVTGGVTTATGGITTATGGITTATGGITTVTGGTTTATGGITTATGGTTTATGGTTTATGGTEPPPIDLDMLFPPPTPPGERKPDPSNPPECPAVAPDNPVGDCLGLPVYVNCKYGTYNCICDWYHWLCAG